MRRSLWILVVIAVIFGAIAPAVTPAQAQVQPFTWKFVGGDPRCKTPIKSPNDARAWFLSKKGQNDLVRLGVPTAGRELTTVIVRNQGVAPVLIDKKGNVSWDTGRTWEKGQFMNLTFGASGTVVRGQIQIAWQNVNGAIGYYPAGSFGFVPTVVSDCCNMVTIFRAPPAARIPPKVARPKPVVPMPPVVVVPAPPPIVVVPPIAPPLEIIVIKNNAETGSLLGWGFDLINVDTGQKSKVFVNGSATTISLVPGRYLLREDKVGAWTPVGVRVYSGGFEKNVGTFPGLDAVLVTVTSSDVFIQGRTRVAANGKVILLFSNVPPVAERPGVPPRVPREKQGSVPTESPPWGVVQPPTSAGPSPGEGPTKASPGSAGEPVEPPHEGGDHESPPTNPDPRKRP